jgi:succinate-semialdehyde dehydrogenase/glutarate-semialdehyde dehydrogenase
MTERKQLMLKWRKAHLAYAGKKNELPARANLLHKVAKLMQLKKSELAKTITLEMGKLCPSEGEIDLSADILLCGSCRRFSCR